MKKTMLLIITCLFIWACGGSPDKPKKENLSPEQKKEKAIEEGKGVGPITKVILNDPLDEEMITAGKGIYELKCAACHKLTPTRIVGPGFKGVTDKRKPEWIMNMITNVETMLEQDPEAQKLLEECLTRMPNQNLTVGEARDVLEFLYSNDAAE